MNKIFEWIFDRVAMGFFSLMLLIMSLISPKLALRILKSFVRTV